MINFTFKSWISFYMCYVLRYYLKGIITYLLILINYLICMFYEWFPVEIYPIYYEWFPYYRRDLSDLLRMIPLLLLRFIWSITNDSPTTVEIYLIYYEWFPYYCRDLSYLLRMISLPLLKFILSITNDTPTTVEIYLSSYQWFPFYCWDLSYLLRMIPLLLLRFIFSISNDSPTTVEIYLIHTQLSRLHILSVGVWCRCNSCFIRLRGCRDPDRMVFGFTATCVISVYHH